MAFVKMPEKVKGLKTKCTICGYDVVCGEKEYQGTTKLQWQNPDGTAHYKKDGDKFVCSTVVVSPAQSTSKRLQESITDNIPINVIQEKVKAAGRVYREVLPEAYAIAKDLNIGNEDAKQIKIDQLCIAKSIVFLVKQ